MGARKIELVETDNKIHKTKKSTICLVQLTRIGDIVQTLQAVRYFRYEHPGIRIIIVAREQFYKPIAFLADGIFDAVYLLRAQDYLKEDYHSNLRNFVNKVSEESIDVLINFSYSKSSSFLCSLIQARSKLGPFYNTKSKIVINDSWSQYIYSNVLGGPYNPFSLVDLYKRVVGVKNKYRPSININELKEKKIIIHPFASDEKKKWKSQKWTEIIYKTLKDLEAYEVVLVGSKEDEIAAREITESALLNKYKNRLRSLVGTSDLEGVYQELKNCHLFIGHDSVVGHLASFADCKSLTVSLGPVRPHETTPYGNKSFCITSNTKCRPCYPDTKCDFFQCHVDIPYQLICETIRLLINNTDLTSEVVKKHISPFHLANACIYKGEMTEANLFRLKFLTGQGNVRSHDVIKPLYRSIWNFALSSLEEEASIPEISKENYEAFIDHSNGIKQLFELCQFGKKYCEGILKEVSASSPELKKIKDHSDKIDEIDELLNILKSRYPMIAPIVNYHLIMKSNIAGINIVELAENTFVTFETLAGHTAALFELCELTSGEFKASFQSSNTNVHK